MRYPFSLPAPLRFEHRFLESPVPIVLDHGIRVRDHTIFISLIVSWGQQDSSLPNNFWKGTFQFLFCSFKYLGLSKLDQLLLVGRLLVLRVRLLVKLVLRLEVDHFLQYIRKNRT